MAKSSIYTVNTTAPTLAVGDIIPIGNTVRRFGQCIRQDGNAISVCGKGYYLVTASIVATPTAAGTITVNARKDGVAIPGATASATVAAANTNVNLTITAILRNMCDCGGSLLSFVLADAAGVINNIAVTVEKL